MQLPSVGYLVVTIPSFLREQFYNTKVLKDFKEYWKRKIKRDLYKDGNEPRGLIRYHWAGEDGSTWKPHLNILINSAWIKEKQLEDWRHELKFWFKNYFKLEKAPAPNLFYRYTAVDGEKYHKIKYITRATMLNFPDIRTKDFFLKELKNFKNTTIFGKFEKVELSQEEDTKIFNNKCIITGQKITWKYYIKDITKIVNKKHLEDKGLGMFYVNSCYVFLNNDKGTIEDLSNLGRSHKRQKIILPTEPPGEILKIAFFQRYDFLIDKFLRSENHYFNAL